MTSTGNVINLKDFFAVEQSPEGVATLSPHEGLNSKKRSASQNTRPKKRTRICRSDDDYKPVPICVLKRPKTIVDHSYYDYSSYQEKYEDKIDYNSDTSESKELSLGLKLHEILEKYQGYCCWQSHGRAFKITIPKKLEMKVCPKYFGHSRYSTFLRQLNNHGFKHITQGRDRNCYYHEAFIRGKPAVTKFMPPPRNRRRLIPDPSSEPDFYLISTRFPLEGQENGNTTDLNTSIQQGKPPAVRDGNNMPSFQGSAERASNPHVAQLQNNSDHGIPLGLASIPREAAAVAAAPIGSQQLSTSVYALLDHNKQMEATREQVVLENLKARNTVTEILRQARQQELTSRLLQSSLNVGLRLPVPQLNSLNDVDYLRRTLANELTPNLSDSLGGVISDLQRNMLHTQASHSVPAVDERLFQLLQDYQNNNPFNL